LIAKAAGFRACRRGNVVTVFAISIVPVIGAVGAAVDYSQANSAKAAMQSAADAAVLALIKVIENPEVVSQLGARSQQIFDANFNRPSIQATVAASYNAGTLILTATANQPTTFMKLLGTAQMKISVESNAALGGGDTWPVCVLVTEPTDNHTLKVSGNSSIDFKDCKVKVNTANWDAVEARDTSYNHSVNGVNCFTGDIHYGDVKPPKEATCTMLPDPYASYTIPTPAACTSANTNIKVTAATTLNPGTFCGGLTIQAATTFNPGVYIIKDGELTISGKNFNVTAKGVTFILTGKDACVLVSLQNGKFETSPADASTAGQFAGFAFFLNPATTNAKDASTIKYANVTTSGVIYLKGQKLEFDNAATVTVNPGSIIAGFILPDGGSKLVLNGSMNTTTPTEIAMRKSLGNRRPVLLPPGQAKKL
jgi:Flp pilus assembly protein TadG